MSKNLLKKEPILYDNPSIESPAEHWAKITEQENIQNIKKQYKNVPIFAGWAIFFGIITIIGILVTITYFM